MTIEPSADPFADIPDETTEDIDYFESENADVMRMFNLEDAIQFTRDHSVEIIRGSDWQFGCWVDGKCYGISVTTLGALLYGMKEYQTHNNKKE